MNGMTEKRSKAKVIDKLLGLGLVQDRKELYKKRGKGKRAEKRRRGVHGDSDNDEEDERGSDNEVRYDVILVFSSPGQS